MADGIRLRVIMGVNSLEQSGEYLAPAGFDDDSNIVDIESFSDGGVMSVEDKRLGAGHTHQAGGLSEGQGLGNSDGDANAGVAAGPG